MITPIKGSKIEYDIKTYKSYRRHRKEEPQAKLKIATGAFIGTALPLLYLSKKQNVKFYNIKYGLKEMLLMTSSAIAGGLAAGLMFDKKEHHKQKLNEGVFQFMNSTVPAILTASLLALCAKFKKTNKAPIKVGAATVGVVGGMHLAANLSNKINDPYDKIPDRKLTLKDSVANIDDAIGVLILGKVPFAQKIKAERILPVVYSLCGYRAGTSN